MGLFSYEEFMDIHTRAIGEGSTFNDAFHRALIVAVRKFLEYHNFKSNLVTEKNLADDTLLSYKNKLKFWHSHEATCRLILFDLNYMIARLGPVKGNQEQKHTGSRQGGQVHGPFRPGKYVFPDPKYARSSHDGPLPPIYTPRKSEYPNPFGKPFKPAESRKSVPPKPEDPSTSNGSFAPPGPGKYAFPSPSQHYNPPLSPFHPRFEEFHPSPTSPHYSGREFSSTHTSFHYDRTSRKYSTSTQPPPRRPDSRYPWTHPNNPNNNKPYPSPPASSGWHPPNNGYAEFFSYRSSTSYRTRTPPRRPPPPPSPPPPPRRPRTTPLPPPLARSNNIPDFYRVLGIKRDATAAEIKTAYRKLSLMHHPDRVGEVEKGRATMNMAEINRANDVLGDEEGRRYYDVTGRVKK